MARCQGWGCCKSSREKKNGSVGWRDAYDCMWRPRYQRFVGLSQMPAGDDELRRESEKICSLVDHRWKEKHAAGGAGSAAKHPGTNRNVLWRAKVKEIRPILQCYYSVKPLFD